MKFSEKFTFHKNKVTKEYYIRYKGENFIRFFPKNISGSIKDCLKFLREVRK